MGKAKRPGSMAPNSLVIIKMEKNMALDTTYLPINQSTKVTGIWDRSLEKVFINGMMADIMMAIGKIIACMDWEYMCGQTEDSTVENS